MSLNWKYFLKAFLIISVFVYSNANATFASRPFENEQNKSYLVTANETRPENTVVLDATNEYQEDILNAQESESDELITETNKVSSFIQSEEEIRLDHEVKKLFMKVQYIIEHGTGSDTVLTSKEIQARYDECLSEYRILKQGQLLKTSVTANVYGEKTDQLLKTTVTANVYGEKKNDLATDSKINLQTIKDKLELVINTSMPLSDTKKLSGKSLNATTISSEAASTETVTATAPYGDNIPITRGTRGALVLDFNQFQEYVKVVTCDPYMECSTSATLTAGVDFDGYRAKYTWDVPEDYPVSEYYIFMEYPGPPTNYFMFMVTVEPEYFKAITASINTPVKVEIAPGLSKVFSISPVSSGDYRMRVTPTDGKSVYSTSIRLYENLKNSNLVNLLKTSETELVTNLPANTYRYVRVKNTSLTDKIYVDYEYSKSPIPIVLSQKVAMSILYSDYQVYKFNVPITQEQPNIADQYSVTVDNASGRTKLELFSDPYMKNLLATVVEPQYDYSLYLVLKARLVPGDYYVKVSELNKMYSISSNITLSKSSREVTSIDGTDVSINYNKQDKDTALIKITPTKSGVYEIFTDSYEGNGQSSDTVISLYNGIDLTDSNYLATNDDYNGTSFSYFKQLLTAGKDYYLVLQGKNQAAFKARFNFRAYDVSAPSTPTLVLQNKTASSITLAWQASTDDRQVTGYKIYSTVNGVPTLIKTAGKNELSYTVNSINTYYNFYIKAVDSSGLESEYSNKVNFMLLSGKLEYIYDSRGRLEKIILPGGNNTIYYQSDANGNSLRKSMTP